MVYAKQARLQYRETMRTRNNRYSSFTEDIDVPSIQTPNCGRTISEDLIRKLVLGR